MMRALIALLCLLPAAAGAADYRRGDVVEGSARVIDGDTVEVARVRVRLAGVAAPERSEAGGPAATEALRRIVAGQTVRCALSGERSHDRQVGVCWAGSQDIGAAVIAAGVARDCPRYSNGRYAALEPPEAARLPLPRYCR